MLHNYINTVYLYDTIPYCSTRNDSGQVVHTHVPLFTKQYIGIGQRAVMLCGWEGNRRSGIALAKHHRLSGISTYGLNGLGKGDEHPA